MNRNRNHKAVVMADGKAFRVVSDGIEYRVFPALNAYGEIQWIAQDQPGYMASGRNIWQAIKAHRLLKTKVK